MKLRDSGREKIEDKIIDTNLDSDKFHHKNFVRIGSKDQSFRRVIFDHSYFENCYFRNITFDSCSFIGCKFVNCNFQGSTFLGSTFDYATFEKTYISAEILDSNCPNHNNLILKFARSLRMNFQAIGESESVNKAIKLELKATREHLFESWNSRKSYYRNKYRGFDRFKMFYQWFFFKIQDFVWGNGESPNKLIRAGLIFWILISIVDTLIFKNHNLLSNYLDSLSNMPSIFMGIEKPDNYPAIYLTFISVIRYIGFALFTSIIIKRYSRR